jgi:hypothetical protein
VQSLITGEKRPKHTQITRIIEGFETLEFRSYFDKWSFNGQHPVSEEGRGKVAGTGMLKFPNPFTSVCQPYLLLAKDYDEYYSSILEIDTAFKFTSLINYEESVGISSIMLWYL